jgi:two-component system, sensor histidine kinase and response regulator
MDVVGTGDHGNLHLPPLDMAHLNEITDGDAEFIEQLKAEFMGSAIKLLSTIHAAADSKDPAELRAAAHTLKGSSRTIGALQLADAAAILEQEALQNLVERWPATTKRIEEAWKTLEHFLLQNA